MRRIRRSTCFHECVCIQCRRATNLDKVVLVSTIIYSIVISESRTIPTRSLRPRKRLVDAFTLDRQACIGQWMFTELIDLPTLN